MAVLCGDLEHSRDLATREEPFGVGSFFRRITETTSMASRLMRAMERQGQWTFQLDLHEKTLCSLKVSSSFATAVRRPDCDSCGEWNVAGW